MVGAALLQEQMSPSQITMSINPTPKLAEHSTSKLSQQGLSSFKATNSTIAQPPLYRVFCHKEAPCTLMVHNQY